MKMLRWLLTGGLLLAVLFACEPTSKRPDGLTVPSNEGNNYPDGYGGNSGGDVDAAGLSEDVGSEPEPDGLAGELLDTGAGDGTSTDDMEGDAAKDTETAMEEEDQAATSTDGVGGEFGPCGAEGQECDDGDPCTTSSCAQNVCTPTKMAENSYCIDASKKQGQCNAAGKCISTCGNGICDAGETTAICPADCKPPHPCDNHCVADVKHPTYDCYCDNVCKTNGDCCTTTGGKANTCTGSTCGACN